MKAIVFILATVLSTSVLAYPKIPKIWLAPGEFCTENDRDFIGYQYPDRVARCKRNVSYQTKNKICRLYGVYDRRDYTVDHIIPLSLGGSNSEKNLWCQSRKIITASLEFYYYRMVRDGKMRHAFAIHALMAWKFDPTNKDHIPKPPDGIYYPDGQ
jgi:hypothetical protein